MSSLVTGSRPAESRPDPATVGPPLRRPSITADAILGLALAGALTLLALLTTGGVELGPNTWSQIVLTSAAAALAATVLLVGARRRAWGGATLALFGALAALTFASIAWSVQPADSWLEANRTLSYLTAFMAAMALARLAPGRWRAMVGGVGAYCVAICGVALLFKVFPATFDASDVIARLRAPFDYWNATGLVPAMGLPACLWAGARRDGGRLLRALSVPAIALLLVVLVLSYSRGGVVATVVAVACWFALGPDRLRGALVLGIGGAGAAGVSAWALSTPGVTADHMSIHARSTAGHELGILLLVVVAALAAAGYAAVVAMERVAPPEPLRRRLGIALALLVALVPVGALGAAAASSRGFGGEVSHVWSTVTSTTSVVGDKPGRLWQLGSSRPRYWREGLRVGEHAPLAGVGALGFATAGPRYTYAPLPVVHAHSYVVETFADFGAIGLALSLALLVAWALAVRRTLTKAFGAELSLERAGLAAMLATALAFGASSLIDWTWFIPGVAVPALLCAGWLAARGPLAEPAGRLPRRRSLMRAPGVAAGVVGLAAAALIAVWVIWQPLRSADADGAAISALVAGNPHAALVDARTAAAADPVAADPLWELAAIYSGLGESTAAHAELARATTLQPDNPATWEQLGQFDLQHGRGAEAVAALRRALRLDPGAAQIQQTLAQAVAAAARG